MDVKPWAVDWPAQRPARRREGREPEGSRPSGVRSLVGGAVDWSVTLTLTFWAVFGLHAGQWSLLIPVLLFAGGAYAGRTIGGLLTGVVIVDADHGGRLSPSRALLRAVVELVLTALTMLVVWGVGAVFGLVIMAEATAVGLKSLVSGDNSGVPYIPMFVATFCAAAGADRLWSALSGRPWPPWDTISRSRAIRPPNPPPRGPGPVDRDFAG